MTDRELLERAAKAAGAKWTDYSDRTPDHWVIQHADGVWRIWNPLVHDGDALRLAVKLRIDLAWNGAEINAAGAPDWVSEVWHDALSPEAATRRAIVRAAAAIGGAAHD